MTRPTDPGPLQGKIRLTSIARCNDAGCDWTSVGDQAAVDRQAERHVKQGHHSVTTETRPVEA